MQTILSNYPVPRLPKWRFWLPLILQILLIISVPAGVVHTYMTGKTVFLQTAPVDPYSPMLGYSQILSYDISRTETLKKLPGWKDFPKDNIGDSQEMRQEIKYDATVYVILEAPSILATYPFYEPWRPVAIRTTPPTNLPDNQIYLKGKSKFNRVEYGMETYYMPEDRVRDINQEFATEQGIAREQEKLPPIVVEARINPQGAGVPVSIWVRDRKYTF